MKHQEIQDAVPLLALGGLPEAERAELEAHLAVCPACRALLSEYSFVAQELDEQVPQLALPAGLEARLMAQVPTNGARTGKQTARTKSPARRTTGLLRQPVTVPRWAFVAIGVVLLLLLGVAAGLWLNVQQMNAIRAAQVAQLLTTSERKFIPLNGGTGSGTPAGTVYLSPDNATALLWLYNMPELDQDHAYQVWLRRTGERVSGGLFRPGYDGRAVVVVNAPDALKEYTDIGITVEPISGSAGPTTPRVIGGKLD